MTQKTITTTTEETTTTTTYENSDDSINKKRKIDNENTTKSEFDASARKYIDWIDNIERILDEKPSNQLQTNERQNIIQVNFNKLIFFFIKFFSFRKLKRNIYHMMIN